MVSCDDDCLSLLSFFLLVRFFFSSVSFISPDGAVLAFNAALLSLSSLCFDLVAGADFFCLCRVVLLRDPCVFDGVSLLCVESSIVEDDFLRLDLLRREGALLPLTPRSGVGTSFFAVSSCGTV